MIVDFVWFYPELRNKCQTERDGRDSPGQPDFNVSASPETLVRISFSLMETSEASEFIHSNEEKHCMYLVQAVVCIHSPHPPQFS